MLFLTVLVAALALSNGERICNKICNDKCVKLGHKRGECIDEAGCVCMDVRDNGLTVKKAKSNPACDMENADEVCAAFCQWTTGEQKGYCNDEKECICGDKPTERKKRGTDELACKMSNGDEVCAAFCHWTTGEQKGYCNDQTPKKCVCGEKPTTERKKRAADETACKVSNGDEVCAAFCHWTTGEQKGYCNDETPKKCVCGDKPTQRKKRGTDELACKMSNGDEVCAAFCHWTTGEQKGYCNDQTPKKCVCGEKPTTVSGRRKRGTDELACKMSNGDEVCAAFCHWTTGEQKGYCNDQTPKKCVCGEKPTVSGRKKRGTDELACKMSNGDEVCAAFCHWTTGEQKGYCNDQTPKKCVCGEKPTTA